MLFSLGVRYYNLCLLLAHSLPSLVPARLDIKAAFLYGILTEEIYIQLLEGHRSEKGMCAKSNKAIYSPKQSPRAWFQGLVSFLVPYGLVSSAFDPVYVHDVAQFRHTNEYENICVSHIVSYTPICKTAILFPNSPPQIAENTNGTLYRQLVGSLIFAVIGLNLI